jgi:NarL family two-component system response regulator LiaR
MAEIQKKIRIVIIDDHPLMRRGFWDCLVDTGRFVIAGEADSLEAGRVLMEQMMKAPAGTAGARGPPENSNRGSPPDLIILDIGLGDDNGLDFIGILKTLSASRGMIDPPVLVCSVFEDPFRVRTAVQLGARGYISKSAGEAELIRAIDMIIGGGRYIDRRFEPAMQKNGDLYAQFTRREREILTLIKQRYGNKEIAGICRISLRTVENHLSHIYLKTGIKSREGLISL